MGNRQDLARGAHDASVEQGSCVVVCWPPLSAQNASGHEASTRNWAARCLAAIKGVEFAGDFDADCRYPAQPYFVPKDTICPVEVAAALGIRGHNDLFGGVAPYPFVSTKAITHMVEAENAPAPKGWSTAFGRRVRDVVLPGSTAFTRDDALRAGERLLRDGTLRAKDPGGIGGQGQSVIADRAQLEAHVAELDETTLASGGIVLERNLHEPETLSVGQVRVGALLISYFGVQRLTENNRGQKVYGGSRLVVCRGGFEALLRHASTNQIRLAVVQARKYHEAAFESFPGMFASRSNYDVAQGSDDRGRWLSGVLEQSWRIGGASAAELLALQAFREDRALGLVTASTTEVYGDCPALPDGATLVYSGVDRRVGQLTKYARLERGEAP